MDCFLKDSPASPFEEKPIEAFREYCVKEMRAAGFDLNREIYCRYDSESGNVTFWQEPAESIDPLLVNLN
jgi:hypothetical protein